MFKKCKPPVISSDVNLIFRQKCGCCVYSKYLNKFQIRCLYDNEIMTEMPWICPFWKGKTVKQ